LYFIAFEELESKYSEKFKQYLNFSVDRFVVRINALKAKYEKLRAIMTDSLANQEFYKLIDESVAVESSSSDLLEQMNIYICSSDKLQQVHIIDLYYNMTDYFHDANSISANYKYELAKRLKPELSKALQNFNFTLAKALLAKIKELSYNQEPIPCRKNSF